MDVTLNWLEIFFFFFYTFLLVCRSMYIAIKKIFLQFFVFGNGFCLLFNTNLTKVKKEKKKENHQPSSSQIHNKVHQHQNRLCIHVVRCHISTHGRCHVLPRLTEFSSVVLRCFTLSHHTIFMEVSLI